MNSFQGQVSLLILSSFLSSSGLGQDLIYSTGPSPERRNSSSVNTINETTPSVSMYYDFANQNWQGSDEHKIIADLEFFKYMHERYGMKLDVFLLDAGIIDNGLLCRPVAGRSAYGSFTSSWVQKRFPNRFKNLYEVAKSFGCRLGLYVGPDGFGATPERAQRRVSFLAGLCRDYNLEVLKIDACAGRLRPDKEAFLIEGIKKARTFSPDLVVLNNGVPLTVDLAKQVSSSIIQNQEGYTDVNDFNAMTGLHHRLGSMHRPVTPGMSRLLDDKGVGLSSGMDGWSDDLILQAFNRNTLLAPQIFGNPWLLRDDELAELAYIFNLHARYNSLLVSSKLLPSSRYGNDAVSRGNDDTRLVCLKNLSWNPKKYRIKIDSTLGIKAEGTFLVKQLFPTEKYIGRHTQEREVEVEVQPFRAALFLVTLHSSAIDLRGCDYQVVEQLPGKPVVLKLLGMPGEKAKLTWGAGELAFTKATINRSSKKSLFKKGVVVRFAGTKLKDDYHRRLGRLSSFNITNALAENLFEESCFKTNNNALEIKSLERAGPSSIREVNVARNAFFLDSSFTKLGLWDKYAFDGESNSYFAVSRNNRSKTDGLENEVKPSFRLDMGKTERIDQLTFEKVPTDYDPREAWVSSDLINWTRVTAIRKATELQISFSPALSFRYLRIGETPAYVSEIKASINGKTINRSQWKASNLFGKFEEGEKHAYKSSFTLKKTVPSAMIAISVPGDYPEESVFASLLVDGKPMGATDRSPAYPYNHWIEPGTERAKGNYTFYFPVTKAMWKKKLEAVVVNTHPSGAALEPEAWLTCQNIPYQEKLLVLK